MPQRTLSEQEFSAIRDRVMDSMPGGYSEDDFNRQIGSRMDAAIAEAENMPAKAEGSALGRFASNAGEMLNPVAAAQGIYGAIRHPVDTATNIAGAQYDQGKQAVAAARQGNPFSAAGHAVAAALPVVGPAAAAAGEQIASGDIAGGLGKGVGMLIPVAAPSALRAVRGALPAGVRASAAGALEEGAAARVADVMAPKVGANKTRFGNMAEKVAPTLTEEGGFSREGLHAKVQEGLAGASAALDEATDARMSARTFSTKPMIDALLEKRRALTSEAVEGSTTGAARQIAGLENSGGRPVSGPPAKPIGRDVVPGPNAVRVAELDKAISEIQQLGPVARYDAIRNIRQAYDGPAKAVYSPSMTADFMKAQGGKLGAADVTGVLREHLAKLDPQTAKANAEYSLYKTADDVLEATREVERTRPKVGRRIITRVLATTVGEHAAGPMGAAVGFVATPAIDAAMSSGLTTKLQTARLMTSLAKAIRAGDEGYVISLTSQLRRLGTQAATIVGNATSPTGFQTQTTGSGR